MIRTSTPRQLSPARRWALLIAGFVAVALGLIGVFLPVLPTVPFLLLALACFTRSSERYYTWLLDHDHFGPMVRPYLDGRGIQRATKFKAIALLWASITVSILLMNEVLWVQGILLAVAFGVSLYLLRLPTAAIDDRDEVN